MTAFGKRLDGPGGRRAALRRPVVKAASIMTLQNSRVVSLVDLSTSGAKIDGCGPVRVGQDLWLKIGTTDVFGTAAWTAGDTCGITFEEALSQEQLDGLSSGGEWTMFAALTAEERLAAEDWLIGFVR